MSADDVVPLPRTFYVLFGKRLFDIAAASSALTLLAPLFAAIALIIRLESRGRSLFVQERLGRHGRIFRAYKFRTMTDRPRTPDTVAYSGDPSEITRVGRFLRRSKLDELPQLLNVLKGEMSIVGPRPQLPIQLGELDANGQLRLLVRPGLTGYAQTHGNVELSWPERWHYDARYVREVSLALDIRLILRTFSVVFRGEEKHTIRPFGPTTRN